MMVGGRDWNKVLNNKWLYRQGERESRDDDEVETGIGVRHSLSIDKVCKEKQTKSLEYVLEHIFGNMPINIGHIEGSAPDRRVPYIELDYLRCQEFYFSEDRNKIVRQQSSSSPTSVDSLLEASEKEKTFSPMQNLFSSYPGSVTVKENGDILIERFEEELPHANPLTSPMRTYTIKFDAVSNIGIIPDSIDSPRLKRATKSSIEVEWELPQRNAEIIVIEKHELQVRPAGSHKAWATLCVKNLLLGQLPIASLEGLKPAQNYDFRIRQGGPAGWSCWSRPATFSTVAGPPYMTKPMFVSTVTCDLLVLHWDSCFHANGAPITGYTLRARTAGSKTWGEPIYHGSLDSFVVTTVGGEDVGPFRTYLFDICAHNEVGDSLWSEPATFKTAKDQDSGVDSQRPIDALLSSRKVWLEFWDPATEQVFYFNKYCGLRTTDRPAEFDDAGEVAAEGTAVEDGESPRGVADAAPQQQRCDPAVVFRTRRFRFLRRLYQGSPLHQRLRPSTGRRSRRQRGDTATVRLTVKVRRGNIYSDSFDQFRFLGASDLVRKLKVSFDGEEGIDSGGLTKDWYLSISKAIVSSGMFREVGDGLEINPNWRVLESAALPGIDPSDSLRETLAHYRFVGLLIGKAIYDRHNMLLPFSHVFYKILRNDTLRLEDLERIDPRLHKSLSWMIEHSVEGVLFETFSVVHSVKSAFGDTEEVIDLCERGRDRDVDDVNKVEYVQLLSQYRLHFGMLQQMEAIMDGISASVPLRLLADFDVCDLELLVNGKEEIDVDEIRAYTVYQGRYHQQHRIALWLWIILRELDLKDRSRFLQFVTGAPRMPLDGFDPPFNVTEGADMDAQNALPTAHTCFNQLVVPQYRSFETFKSKLKYAIENSSGYQMS